VDAWKSEDDPYKEFFEDECEFDPTHSVAVADLWCRFAQWAAENGIKHPCRNRLYECLRLQGCTNLVLRNTASQQVRSWGVKII
jgi:hypothetical protein